MGIDWGSLARGVGRAIGVGGGRGGGTPNYGGNNPLGAGNNPFGFPQYGPRTPISGSTQPVIPPVKLPEGGEDFLPGGQYHIPEWLRGAYDLWQGYQKLQGGGGGGGGGGGSMSDFEKWMLILQSVGGITSGVGDFLEGEQFNQREKEKLAENRRQFDVTQGFNEKRLGEDQRQFNIPKAVELSRSQDLAPFRDRAAYMIGQRLGQSPGQFSPATLTQPGTPGGINFGAMQNAAGQYQPGAGGTGPGQELRRRILNSLGTYG